MQSIFETTLDQLNTTIIVYMASTTSESTVASTALDGNPLVTVTMINSSNPSNTSSQQYLSSSTTDFIIIGVSCGGGLLLLLLILYLWQRAYRRRHPFFNEHYLEAAPKTDSTAEDGTSKATRGTRIDTTGLAKSPDGLKFDVLPAPHIVETSSAPVEPTVRLMRGKSPVSLGDITMIDEPAITDDKVQGPKHALPSKFSINGGLMSEYDYLGEMITTNSNSHPDINVHPPDGDVSKKTSPPKTSPLVKTRRVIMGVSVSEGSLAKIKTDDIESEHSVRFKVSNQNLSIRSGNKSRNMSNNQLEVHNETPSPLTESKEIESDPVSLQGSQGLVLAAQPATTTSDSHDPFKTTTDTIADPGTINPPTEMRDDDSSINQSKAIQMAIIVQPLSLNETEMSGPSGPDSPLEFQKEGLFKKAIKRLSWKEMPQAQSTPKTSNKELPRANTSQIELKSDVGQDNQSQIEIKITPELTPTTINTEYASVVKEPLQTIQTAERLYAQIIRAQEAIGRSRRLSNAQRPADLSEILSQPLMPAPRPVSPQHSRPQSQIVQQTVRAADNSPPGGSTQTKTERRTRRRSSSLAKGAVSPFKVDPADVPLLPHRLSMQSLQPSSGTNDAKRTEVVFQHMEPSFTTTLKITPSQVPINFQPLPQTIINISNAQIQETPLPAAITRSDKTESSAHSRLLSRRGSDRVTPITSNPASRPVERVEEVQGMISAFEAAPTVTTSTKQLVSFDISEMQNTEPSDVPTFSDASSTKLIISPEVSAVQNVEKTTEDDFVADTRQSGSIEVQKVERFDGKESDQPTETTKVAGTSVHVSPVAIFEKPSFVQDKVLVADVPTSIEFKQNGDMRQEVSIRDVGPGKQLIDSPAMDRKPEKAYELRQDSGLQVISPISVVPDVATSQQSSEREIRAQQMVAADENPRELPKLKTDKPVLLKLAPKPSVAKVASTVVQVQRLRSASQSQPATVGVQLSSPGLKIDIGGRPDTPVTQSRPPSNESGRVKQLKQMFDTIATSPTPSNSTTRTTSPVSPNSKQWSRPPSAGYIRK